MSKFIHLNSLIRVNMANLNSSEGGGNQITLKKVETFKGEEFVYVSGQAFRRYLRETLYWLTNKEFKITPIDKDGNPIIEKDGKPISEIKPDEAFKFIIKNYEELDMFGFLIPLKNKGHIRKFSPLQVTPLISVFPYNSNSDMMTRSKSNTQGGDIVKVEIDVFNYMQGSQVINCEMVGAYWDENKEDAVNVLKEDEKKERIKLLIDGLKNLMGGAKKARLLNSFIPSVIVGTLQNIGVPYFMNIFDVETPENKIESIKDVRGILNIDRFIHTLNMVKENLEKVYIGINAEDFANGGEVLSYLKGLEDEKVRISNSVLNVFEELKKNV